MSEKISIKILLDNYLTKSLRWWMPHFNNLDGEIIRDLQIVLDNKYADKIINIIEHQYIQEKEAGLLNAVIGIVDEHYEILNEINLTEEKIIDEHGDLLFYLVMLNYNLYGNTDLIVESYDRYIDSKYEIGNSDEAIQFILSFAKKSVFHKKEYDIESLAFKEQIIELATMIFFDNLVYWSISIGEDFLFSDLGVKRQAIVYDLFVKTIDFNIDKLEKRQGIRRVNELEYKGNM